MIALSLVSLLVYLFGAYAYGVATALTLRQVPMWGGRPESEGGTRVEPASLALLVLSTIWFVLHVALEFRTLVGGTGRDWLDLGVLIVFVFPPVIMHTVYRETCDGDEPPAPVYGRLLAAMYALSPAVGAYLVAAIFHLAPRPPKIDAAIGFAIGALFTLASLYCTVFLLRRPRRASTLDQQRMRTVMIGLFIGMGVVFVVLTAIGDGHLMAEVLNRVVRAAPLYFLMASIYFESRLEFYDLVVKRALLLLLSVVVAGGTLALGLPWLERLPAGGARPWLFAVGLAPLAMLMPWLHARAERWLDRWWLGREFTPIGAVTHVLAAIEPAADEPALVAATEARLQEVFGARFVVLPDGGAPPAGALAEISAPNPGEGPPIRLAVVGAPGTRRLLSEDLALARLLAGVFGFMREHLRLQRRRQEQDRVAHDLRLQARGSELKALRAQINPHFLFNALNAILALIHSDPARADEVVERLAEVFRYTLRRSESEWAPLDQELAFARAYLDVERARFGQRLACTVDADVGSPAPQVPSMLLQTLIENAVKHGVSRVRGPARVDVRARVAGDRLEIDVRNTGPASADAGGEPPEGEGFGLRSVRERLAGHFGDQAFVALDEDRAAGLTVARLTMPLVPTVAA